MAPGGWLKRLRRASWPPRASRREIESRLDRLTLRIMVAEAIFATATAMVISAVDEELCRRLLGEVRKSVSVSLTGVNGPNAEWLKLHAEEQAERLLDQIQRFAEFQRKSQQLGTEPT